ncbi:MAG: MASE3 domain-containing protein [Methylobacter sp.]
MLIHPDYRRQIKNVVLFLLLLLIVLVAISFHLSWHGAQVIGGYLPLHAILESFTVVVAALVFSVGWNAYRRELPGNILLIACAFLGVGVLDFTHMLSYTGMPDFITPSGPRKAIFFWLSARTTAAIALFVVAVTPWRPMTGTINRYIWLTLVLGWAAGLHWLYLAHDDWLPVTFIPGQGLTPFKIHFEYGIIGLNLLTAAILLNKMRNPLNFNAAGLFGVVCTMAMSEYFFTRYVDFTDAFNLLGHFYKIISYLYLYFSIFVETVEHPYNQLFASQNQMKAMLEAMPEALFETGSDGHLFYIHTAKSDVPIPVSRQEGLQSIGQFLPSEATAIFLSALTEATNHGYSQGKQIEFGKAEEKHWYVLSVSRKTVGKGQEPRFIVLMHDITARKHAEEELNRYKNQLEQTVQERTADLVRALDAAKAANKAKSQFLASMSHELRTPMNAILGFSNMMRLDSQLTEGQRENLNIINRSGEHLLTLINNVLEMSKIEAGRVELEMTPFDLPGMVQDVYEMMNIRALEKGLQLSIQQAPDLPRHIRGDEGRLRQILVNLVGNALKFTERGSVTIRLGIKHDTHAENMLIEVEDTGIGIKPEQQHRLFEPFVQLAESGEQKGTGLGLAISRQYIQLMNGTISVESTYGNGSLFRVQFPVEMAKAEEIVKAEKIGKVIGLGVGQPRYRVLIVDDQLENQMLLSQLMAVIGQDVIVAENGEQCIELFQDYQPHLIWMDRRMPVMDGLEATRRIRALPGGKEVKIVGVTASVFKEQHQELLDAGMDEVVNKPYRFEDIYESMARQLGIEYSYSSTDLGVEQTVTLMPVMLAFISDTLKQELHNAVISLDSDSIIDSIAKISEVDPKLAEQLARLADDYNYTAIINFLKSENEE